jgi:hypothetical protein
MLVVPGHPVESPALPQPVSVDLPQDSRVDSQRELALPPVLLVVTPMAVELWEVLRLAKTRQVPQTRRLQIHSRWWWG